MRSSAADMVHIVADAVADRGLEAYYWPTRGGYLSVLVESDGRHDWALEFDFGDEDQWWWRFVEDEATVIDSGSTSLKLGASVSELAEEVMRIFQEVVEPYRLAHCRHEDTGMGVCAHCGKALGDFKRRLVTRALLTIAA